MNIMMFVTLLVNPDFAMNASGLDQLMGKGD